MASTSKSKALLIDSGASNHMMDERDSFSSLVTSKSIPIHMGDDSTIILEGQGTVDLENGYFSNVLYVLSLASNLRSVRIINPPLSKFGHMSKLGFMSKSGVHLVYL